MLPFSRLQKISNILNGARAKHTEAVQTRIDSVEQQKDVVGLTQALYSVASCQIELKDLKAAKRTLEDLLKTYPSSEVAPDAKAKLAVLK